MAKQTNGRANSYIIYRTIHETVMEDFTPEQVYEFYKLVGDYMLNGNKEAKSSDKLVNVFFKAIRTNLDKAEERHKQAIENGLKGAEYGKLGGAPKGNQNARKKKSENNPKSTPKQPLEIETEKENEIEREIKIKKESKIEREQEGYLVNSHLSNLDFYKDTGSGTQKEYSASFNEKDKEDFASSISLDDFDDLDECAASMDLNRYWEKRLKMGLGM